MNTPRPSALLFALLLLPGASFTQGFPATSLEWGLPPGGQVDGGVNQGFNLLSAIGYAVGSDTWSTIDINGDGLTDLVCTGTRAANGFVTEFSPASNSYWKVYLNTGNGFSTTSTTWSLPPGGQVDGGVDQGFNLLSAIGFAVGSDSWSTIDINGDALPDLVCTGTRAANGFVTEFSPANNSYWKVYLNTGNGFSATPTNWSLPPGGQVDGGVDQGFNLLSAIGYAVGADTWSTIDIDGDARPDLVCTGTRAANGFVTEFSPDNNSYWKVYLNTGSGFSATPSNWPLPPGGQVDGGVDQGFNLLSAIGYAVGADTWSTIDINGDALPDLVCTGTRAANGFVTEFSPTNNSYWKVYLNTGSGFSTASITWPLPPGGQVDGGVDQGFNLLSAIGYAIGSDTWSTLDIDGDALPDLVCTGTRAANGFVTEFSPTNNSYWKVYLNTGNGFNSSPTNWSLPPGGQVDAGVDQGFNLLSAIGYATGSDTWSTLDINGDAIPDLVCTGTRAANGFVTEFSPDNTSYWKVYLQENTTALSEPLVAEGLRAYPNPAHTMLEVSGASPLGELSMTDAVGRVVMTERVNSDRTSVEVSSLPRGMYLLSARGSQGLRTMRVAVE